MTNSYRGEAKPTTVEDARSAHAQFMQQSDEALLQAFDGLPDNEKASIIRAFFEQIGTYLNDGQM